MDKILFRIGIVLTVVGVLVCAPQLALGQEEEAVPQIYDESGVWVYASYNKVPWPRVDSLLALNRVVPAWREKAIEMGCFLDWEMLIHHTGSEYNVVTMITYDSWEDMGPGGDCGTSAFREVVSDSTARAANQAGRAWVFGDNKHYDEIYWQLYKRP